ncbi:membrane bound O-acyl transferase family-domain-containing protein [Macrophomina phaseolina]|uniref:Membrane bound O-acyl transferase family-domain-containing protein n=1 Tax=Macrophomina phaseolina TaxID=35725 RepID=A0ABQ8GBA6_9PEZI|nr:membrane bound O-acyl transferase family-domain-containing protein [Macrophomina phaseolina]
MTVLVTDAILATAGPRTRTLYELILDNDRTEIAPWVAQLFLPAFLCVGIVSIVPPPGPMRVMLGLAAFTTLWWYSVTHWFADQTFLVGPIVAVPITLRWAFMVMWGTPEEDYFHLDNRTTSPHHLGPLRKLKWSADLWVQWRGVGWNWKVDNVPESSPSSGCSPRFVLTQIFWVVVKIGAFQVLTRYAFCPLYPAENTVQAFLSLPLWQQNYISAMQLFLGTLSLDSTYRIFTIFAVGLGISKPEYNAPFFGSLADAYSVRQFWGKYWHQTFRKVLNTAGEVAAWSVGAKKGTLVSRYLKTYTGYVTSGAMHAAPGLFILHSSPLTSLTHFLHMPLYAVIVTVEDALKACGKRIGIKDSALVRIAGYFWTAFWIPFIYRYALIFVIDIGFHDASCPA